MGCLGWGLAVVAGVPLGLWGLTWGLNALYATVGGRLTISLVFLTLCAGGAWLLLRASWPLLRGIAVVVGGPLGAGFAVLVRARGLRPRAREYPQGIVPGGPLPKGEQGPGDASPGDVPSTPGDASGSRNNDVLPTGGRRWLIDKLVPYGPAAERRGYVTAILGSRGTGKSVALVDLAISLLNGEPWWGLRGRHARNILIVDLELDGESFRERAAAVARGHGLPHVPKGLHYLNLYGDSLAVPDPAAPVKDEPSLLLTGARFLRALGVEATYGATGMERVALRARRVRADAVCIDSLTLGSIGSALSDTNGWNRELSALEGLGVPIVVIDHLGKNAGAGAAGSFLKEARFRSVVTLTRERGGALKVEHTKSNFGAAVPTFRVVDDFTPDPSGAPRIAYRLAAGNPAPVANATPGVRAPGAGNPAPVAFASARPAPAPLPRPVLRLVPPAVSPIGDTGELRGHAAVDAKVLAAVRQRGGDVDKAALAEATGYAPKTVANALARLRKAQLLPRPAAPATRLVVRPESRSAQEAG